MNTIMCRIEKKVNGMFWHRPFTRFNYSKNMWYNDCIEIPTDYKILNIVEVWQNQFYLSCSFTNIQISSLISRWNDHAMRVALEWFAAVSKNANPWDYRTSTHKWSSIK